MVALPNLRGQRKGKGEKTRHRKGSKVTLDNIPITTERRILGNDLSKPNILVKRPIAILTAFI